MNSPISTYGEFSLHAALKESYAQPGDRLEVEVDGFVIDIARDDLLIEIQTRHLYALKRKLKKLLARGYRLHLVHPIPREKWIVRQSVSGERIGRRKSPKRGAFIDLFRELVRTSGLVPHPQLTLEIALTREEEILRDDGQGSWQRKGWSVHDRRLLEIVERRTFHTPADFLSLLPPNLPTPFTNRQLQRALNCHKTLAPKITYTLRKMGQLELVGVRGRTHLYAPAGKQGE